MCVCVCVYTHSNIKAITAAVKNTIYIYIYICVYTHSNTMMKVIVAAVKRYHCVRSELYELYQTDTADLFEAHTHTHIIYTYIYIYIYIYIQKTF